MAPPDGPRGRVIGSVLAFALGDAFGAPHEGGVLERVLWSVIGRRRGKRRWTDDTQMTIDVMESLLACGQVDPEDLAARFAGSYRWSRGYGPGAARVLKRIRRGESWQTASRAVYAEGSFGNGGAMRCGPVGLYFASRGAEAVVRAAEQVAAVTHAHLLAQEGAAMIALATALAFQGADPPQMIERLMERIRSEEHSRRLAVAARWIRARDSVEPGEIVHRLGRGIAAANSCTTAVYLAMRFLEGGFEELLAHAIRLGGDVDTIAAMAGGIWGAARGHDELPAAKLAVLEDCDRLTALAGSFADSIDPNRAGHSA